jgi:TRAP-type mannitol/chloroaromatic compound transport system permease small subunit
MDEGNEMNKQNAFLEIIDRVNDWLGRILAFGILPIFVLVFGEVIWRYFLKSPTVWANELTQLIFGAYALLCGGYILRWKGHINVDILYSRFSTKGKAIVDIATSVLFFLFCGMILLFGGSLAWESLESLEHSQSAWNPPIYPVKLMLPVGAALILLQGIAKLIRDILTVALSKEIPTHEAKERGEV